MDRLVRTTSILILFSAVIAITGILFGDQIETNLPGGKATGVVAGVAILLGLFVTAYKNLSKLEKNILDKEGFKNLMEIHFGSVSNQLMHLCNEAFIKLEKQPDSYNPELLSKNIKSVIDRSRAKLSCFRTTNIDNIPAFLDQYLSADKQRQILHEIIDIVKTENSISEKNKLTYQLIQSVQHELLIKL